MRIAIVTESFAPDVNGVANSVLRIAEHLVRRGHQPLVVAPRPALGLPAVPPPLGYPVVRVPSMPLPTYPAVRIALPGRALADTVRAHGAEIIHLASPFVLGARASVLAARLDIPTVAVYQTDLAAYASAYRVGAAEAYTWRRLRRIHNAAARTLAPSTSAAVTLQDHGVRRVWLWRRGVDTTGFNPAHRSAAVRRALAPRGEVLVGYVGRLAVEKRVDLLAATANRLPGVRVVIVGDGPERDRLRRAMPGAVFLGTRRGAQLARVYASLDIFVHTGPHETFGQTIQEALASGVPVVAPAAGGPLDLVDHGRSGYLVTPNDAAAVAAAVADLAADAELRDAFGRHARAAVAGRSWTAVGDELIDHYVAVNTGGLGVTLDPTPPRPVHDRPSAPGAGSGRPPQTRLSPEPA